MDRGRPESCTVYLEATRGVPPQEGLGHLAPARVAHPEEQYSVVHGGTVGAGTHATRDRVDSRSSPARRRSRQSDTAPADGAETVAIILDRWVRRCE